MGHMKNLYGKKILVLGHGRHGKDTVAERLNLSLGMSFQSSSQACSDYFIFDRLKGKYGYKSSDECYADRHSHRVEWFNLISEYNSKDKTRLARNILESNQLYIGMRCREELNACIEANIFDHIVWVDASGRLPPEDIKSNTITMDDADAVILNNGTLLDLDVNIITWLKQHVL
ncbi:MAG: hypothetical protein KUG81_09560 [Gammaproteobacteria bacterium]|nr:hypothetical protein [Gammaproteobacteria bacterium]